ncbi:pyruvate, water dikinase regulatory protein [uncultured Amnibacterium sp.]|uniref:pyruvate, water dikinase regulatory protein n=1 Tax=uncultured Amnibacterium sp. TaxID=1631851 RepID=UPI0035C9E3DB
MTSATPATALRTPPAPDVVRVFFISDSTGISAETMGNALLLQFPDLPIERRLLPFVTTVEEAAEIVARLDAAAAEGPAIAFSTTAAEDVRTVLLTTRCTLIDFFDLHLRTLEGVLDRAGTRRPARLHGIGDAQRYNARMAAVEYAMEHDDGASGRALDKADVVLLAPSRCGKTPTTMYLALQHGLLVANYPLVPEDLEVLDLPEPVRRLRARCFGILTTPERLSQVRTERRSASTYASIGQCAWELDRAARMFRSHRIPTVDSSAKSVEEMSTVILQHLARASAPASGTAPQHRRSTT